MAPRAPLTNGFAAGNRPEIGRRFQPPATAAAHARMGGTNEGGAIAAGSPRALLWWLGFLLLQLALQDLDLLGQRAIGIDQVLDLANRVQHGGVVTATEATTNLRQRAQRQ